MQHMEKLLDTIIFKYSDPVISDRLSSIPENDEDYPVFFNQNEDAFIKTDQSFLVPSFPVHHDVKETTPSGDYLSAIRELTAGLTDIFPGIFSGTRYFFDPSEILRPCFIQLLKIEDCRYMYLFRLDLNVKLTECRVLTPPTNDRTAEIETRRLYFESMIIPIYKPDMTAEGGSVPVNRLFSSTWIGETGKGYLINGYWIDREATKFMSALFLPENKKSYPYYPFRCDFNTVVCVPPLLSTEGRRQFLGYFHKSLPMITDEMSDIESTLKSQEFSRDLPLFTDLRKKIPEEWTKIWASLKISPYLNENEMREYSLEYEL